MRALLPPGAPLWVGAAESAAAALRSAAAVRSVAEPHLHPLLATLAPLDPAPRLFPPVARPCTSFSQWWTRCTRDVHSLEALLHQAD
jgi:deoxyribodipyrimidine photo-lyase